MWGLSCHERSGDGQPRPVFLIWLAKIASPGQQGRRGQEGGLLGLLNRYHLRLERKRWRLRARGARFALRPVRNRVSSIDPADILLFCVLRNERQRLPHFLEYYRRLGIGHFLIVDNGSTDGSRDYLESQSDVSLWHAGGSYARARYGMDWLNGLLSRYGRGHWCLTVDADEFLIYPFCDTRPLAALTDWLDASSVRSFGTLLLDMYPRGPVGRQTYRAGEDPFEILSWFDGGNYRMEKNPRLRNLWIQGGPRERMFFSDRPAEAPALNKIPLVKWQRGYAYASSTHALLPRGLNLTYDESGGEKASGCLMHAKLLPGFPDKVAEEAARGEHYAGGREYLVCSRPEMVDFWTRWSERYEGWRQVELLGLMSRGNWA